MNVYDLSNYEIRKREDGKDEVFSKICGHEFVCQDFSKFKSKQKTKGQVVCPVCRKVARTGNSAFAKAEYISGNYIVKGEEATSKLCGHTFKIPGGRGLGSHLGLACKRNTRGCVVCRDIEKALKKFKDIQKRVTERDEEYRAVELVGEGHLSKVKIIHKRCGREFFMRPSAFLHDGASGQGNRCPYCTANRSTLSIKLEDLLDEMGIIYEKEVTFPDFKNPFTNRHLRFDYLIKFKKGDILLEIDGHQHFLFLESWWGQGGHSMLAKNKYLDFLKNKYCGYKNIPLYRVPLIYLPENYSCKSVSQRTRRKDDDILKEIKNLIALWN